MATTRTLVEENYKGWKIERVVTEYMTPHSTEPQRDINFEAEHRNSQMVTPIRDLKIEGLIKQIDDWFETLQK